jgi:Txe/YoeB family toxin of Txe-Axe toxin-antitoxin module
MAPPWLINITDEADADLRRLRKVRRKVWRRADGIIESLKQDPYIGESCEPPWEAMRNIHFWNDQYRLAWSIYEEFERVDVLACDLKTQHFYGRAFETLVGLPDRLTD